MVAKSFSRKQAAYLYFSSNIFSYLHFHLASVLLSLPLKQTRYIKNRNILKLYHLARYCNYLSYTVLNSLITICCSAPVKLLSDILTSKPKNVSCLKFSIWVFTSDMILMHLNACFHIPVF